MNTVVEVYKKTDDDWHPCIASDDGDLVSVSYFPPMDKYVTTYRVCAWGNDDCGVEKDYENEKEAWTEFLQIIGWDKVNREGLKEMGFIPA
jgi:hypothetical protein